MSSSNQSPTPKLASGCMGCLILVFVLTFLPMLYFLAEPRFRTAVPVELTILDEAHRPVAGATLSFHEYEFIALIPWLVFASPHTSIERDRSTTTDQQGKAHFGIQSTAHATSITSSGVPLTVVEEDSTAHSFSNPIGEETHHRANKAELPTWNILHGGRRTWTTTIIVKHQ